METSAHKPFPIRQPKPGRWLGWGALLALLIWLVVDLSGTRKNSLRAFDPKALAQVETAMWRSYYEKKPVLLFWQLAGGLRQQFHAPFWRSFKIGFQATKAAFAFKKGHYRTDYQQFIPDLIAYYQSIQELSTETFDIPKIARLELEWWIIHRQRERYSYKDLAEALAQTAAAQYNMPAVEFKTYGILRADAMRLRDESSLKAGGTTETDWQRIDDILNRAWTSLHQAVQLNK